MSQDARLQSCPQHAEHVVARTLDDDTVLLNLHTEEYYSLGDVGSRIWDLVDGKRTVAEIVDVIAAEYTADRAEVTKDTCDLLEDLAREGLICWLSA
jgi:pyrroloquinoline quinone biosynthesis protein D